MKVVAVQVPSGRPAMAERNQPLGVVLGRFARRLHRLEPVALVQGDEALRPDPRRRDLGLHVADHKVRGPDVVAKELPHRLDLPS